MTVKAQTIDCRGMQCPAPILHLAKAARSAAGQQALLEVLVDDSDFPKDVKAWCRASKAELLEMYDERGVITARIGINGYAGDGTSVRPPASTRPVSSTKLRAQTAAPAAAPSNPGSVSATPSATGKKLDCRGLRCPAPILQIAKVARQLPGATLVVLADDDDFPADLKAWCRTSRATLERLDTVDGAHRAILRLFGEKSAMAGALPSAVPVAAGSAGMSAAASVPVAAQAPAAVAPAVVAPVARAVVAEATAPGSVASVAEGPLDLRGLRAPTPILRLSSLLVSSPGARVSVLADDPTFMTDLMAWSAATKVTVLSATQLVDGGAAVELQLGEAIAGAPSPATTAVPQALVPVTSPGQQLALAPAPEVTSAQENRCTILIIKNDFESLMAAMLCATTSAAQGMEVVMFYSFWGVNVLRGDRKRPIAKDKRVSLMQKMMQWMMPAGPKRQKMSKMHMGGMGKGMMQYFMGKNNVMRLEELMADAVEQNVRFVVCSMSMGIMGIQKRDIVDLPNVEFAGVASFVEMSARSRMSLVF